MNKENLQFNGCVFPTASSIYIGTVGRKDKIITKEKFERYIKVQKLGKVNMWDVKSVMRLSGLTDKECFDIRKNYKDYKIKWGK